jgi:hypothetical protein
MKIPSWLIVLVCGALVSVMGFYGKCAWDANAAISSNKATVDALNTKVNDNKENANKDIQAVCELLKEFKAENKEAHAELKQILRRRDR